MQPRLVEVKRKVLKQNDLLAAGLRLRFAKAGMFVVSLVSSPGSGKTQFLESTLSILGASMRIGVLVGDLATENDAARLGRTGVPVKQITTGTICHLDAQMIENALGEWDLTDNDCLFIENVGNLVCPSSYDLGETLRGVLMSVTEGEDKPLKYPTIYNTSDIAVITKMDLAAAVGFDLGAARKNIQAARPGIQILEVSAKTGLGMDEWIDVLRSRMKTVCATAA